MDEALDHVKDLAKCLDEDNRSRLVNELRDLIISLEPDEDAVQRITFALYAARIGVRLCLFHLLASSDSGIHLDRLAKETSADEILLGRIMRYLASVRMITELGPDVFAANKMTLALATPKGESYINAYYELILPVMAKMPPFLERTGYSNPTDSLNLPLHDAFGCKGDLFAFLKAHPEKCAMFHNHMHFQRNQTTNWAKLATVLRSKKTATDEVLFVDVGGGTGHQCQRVLQYDPDIPGRFILQDLPQVMEAAPTIPGFYYFRGVLHDFPDSSCRSILRNTAKAMRSDSTLLLDEMVLPNSGVDWTATAMDLQMMANLGAQERTRGAWTKLLESAGLKLVDIQYHGLDPYQALIFAVKQGGERM
ncbi:S-adenosyl-L-methionine-dependent methyltransferase [Aspergillus brunneoviolaceus CBS 621.78]|uniref:S-adenosyl-L-methionine-dependent methyltransferase n=1 Tax=Aspergillus brunneoviolaceus CBS 621.78 TaxID=1450534 RepID=A0ACD1G5T6_9EURO|nr:S-adenosyl-L-methionine-dependent methyltransferase [Aspergillus brunneoviolaceus CBS 621.78]RAH44622.1 S-adenosyl-L-methionine-dependent methyltransferase [Aspergillus brunneoviolaceus CBS 621.78]